METINIQIDITVPAGKTKAEILKAYTDLHGYQDTDGTRAVFARKVIANQVREDIKTALRKEAVDKLVLTDVSVV
jgi:hypothetical protein